MKKIDSELDALYIGRPTIESRATQAIEDIINFIEKLIEKGHAYSTNNGDVFFRVSSFYNYGKFSNRQIEESIPDNTEDILQWLGEMRELLKEKGILKKATEQALVLNRPLTKKECDLLIEV